jgi:hypothetical protein
LITHKIGSEEYAFKVPLAGNGGKLDASFDCGTVSGKFVIKDPPRFMQLTGGISTERGTNGRVFLPGLEVPINYSEYVLYPRGRLPALCAGVLIPSCLGST